MRTLMNVTNIFDYMNGGGELYLAYRFHHLEVYEYSGKGKDSILVELYFMETSDDAFGLLSLDWTGEPIQFSDTTIDNSISPPVMAIYGAGLLRMQSDKLYIRILANYDTPELKKAVLDLGKAIFDKKTKYNEPELLKVFPLHIDSAWKLLRDRISFFRSHLVLNSIYYLSHENILNLDLSTEAVIASYELVDATSNTSERCRLLLIRYENPEKARNSLNLFQKSYLSEMNHKISGDSVDNNQQIYKVEDGWMGYKLSKNFLVMVFECPSRDSVGMIINSIESNL